jgi:hypothetical protein
MIGMTVAEDDFGDAVGMNAGRYKVFLELACAWTQPGAGAGVEKHEIVATLDEGYVRRDLALPRLERTLPL